MLPCRKRESWIAVAVAASAFSAAAWGTDVTWIGPQGGSWWNPSHWTAGVVPNNSPAGSFDVRIDGAAADSTVVLDQQAKVSTLTVDAGDTLNLARHLGIEGATLVNSGTIAALNTFNSTIRYYGDLTLSGGGTILAGVVPVDSSVNAHVINLDNTVRASIGTESRLTNYGTITGDGLGASIGVANFGTLINHGIVKAQNAGLLTHAGTLINHGVVRAESGGVVSLLGYAISNHGSIEATADSRIELESDVIGGVLRTSGSGLLRFANVLPITLSGVTLDGHLEVTMPTSPASLRIGGTLHNLGTITIGGSPQGSELRIPNLQTATLTGGGMVVLNGMSSTAQSFVGGIYGGGTLVSDNTIRGNGIIGFGKLVSTGTIAAAGQLRLSALNPLTNQGVMLVEPGAHMSIEWHNRIDSTAGSIRVMTGGSLTMSMLQPDALPALSSGSIELDGHLTVAAGTLLGGAVTGSGSYTQTGGFANVQSLRLRDASIAAGSTQIASGASTMGTSHLNALTISGSGKLDLTDHDLILNYAPEDPIDPDDIRQMLASAYAGGAWTGPGLTSSSAGTSNSPKTGLGYLDNLGGIFTTFSGQAVDDSSILVKYTLTGDANLDGTVDVRDLHRLSLNWFGSGFWENGDFNYDGLINAADLSLLARNWNGNLADALASVGFEGVSIPEPAAGISILGLLFLPRRRCRMHRIV